MLRTRVRSVDIFESLEIATNGNNLKMNHITLSIIIKFIKKKKDKEPNLSSQGPAFQEYKCYPNFRSSIWDLDIGISTFFEVGGFTLIDYNH
jgi:hypothetical protein